MGEKKTALITGAGGGIGSAVSKRFLQEGYRVILVDKDPASLRAKYGDVSLKDNVTQIVADLANGGELQSLRTVVDCLDGGLAAAAFCHGGCFVDGKPFPNVEYWDLNYRQNTIACVNAFQCCAEGLRKGRGNLVIASSVDAILAMEGAGPYDAAKASLLSLARSISRAYAPEVCAIALILGTVCTEAWNVAIEQDPDVLHKRGNENLAGRVMLPEEVAGLVWLLCQEEARIMRGQSVIADNGWSFLAGTFRFDEREHRANDRKVWSGDQTPGTGGSASS
ncbi:MAG: SDR family NAD(P)-dependent oxidoreductase [Lentisphaerae bacterium]|nr:SDR family NAD(P)-dependent oxidoreductase [Lentisphaerota bacterium]